MFPFMSCYRIGNRYIWHLPDGLPIGEETVTKNFLFRNELWRYSAQFEDRGEGEMLWITLSCTRDIVASFDVKCGITETLRTHIESKMLGSNTTSPFFGKIQINRSELADLIELKCLVRFFIEITEENNGETSKREDERKALKMKASKLFYFWKS